MILVIAEQKDGALNRATWEAIAGAQQLGGPITIVLPGAGGSAAPAELAAADCAGVIALEHAALGTYTADGYVQALTALIQAEKPAHVVFAHTYQTRDFAPRLAARLDCSIATDCIGVKPGPLFVRPMFQGKVSADVALDGPAPHLITFQIGAFRGDSAKKGAAAAS